MAGRVTHHAARSCLTHGVASGAVDTPPSAKLHLTDANLCPIKQGHFLIFGNATWQWHQAQRFPSAVQALY